MEKTNWVAIVVVGFSYKVYLIPSSWSASSGPVWRLCRIVWSSGGWRWLGPVNCSRRCSCAAGQLTAAVRAASGCSGHDYESRRAASLSNLQARELFKKKKKVFSFHVNISSVVLCLLFVGGIAVDVLQNNKVSSGTENFKRLTEMKCLRICRWGLSPRTTRCWGFFFYFHLAFHFNALCSGGMLTCVCS